MKRWIALLIVFGLMGSIILMSSCTSEEVDGVMSSTYVCGDCWTCSKDCATRFGEACDEASCVTTDTEGNELNPLESCMATVSYVIVYVACDTCIDCICEDVSYSETE